VREGLCPGCGTKVGCGAAPGKTHCWCADFPRILPVPDPGTDCLCPECLRREILRRQQDAGTPSSDPACH